MAVTKIHPIKSTLKKALDYICDAGKTDDKVLVSSFACTPETADIEFEFTRKQAPNKSEVVLARHLIQAFEPGEVTPELAHELGRQFADEVLGGKYEYVLSTHIDKNHVHNHIIFNNVNLIDHKRYDSNKKSYHQLRTVSDRICKENGLSVIKDPIAKNIGRAEYEKDKQGLSWKAKLKKDIDGNIGKSKNFNQFLEQMEKAGYQIKHGKHIAFKAAGQERYARAKTLGDNYTEDAIKKRIAEQGRDKKRNVIYRPNILKINLLKNLQAHALAKNRGLDRWTKIHNLQEAAKTLNFLTTHQITSCTQLEEKAIEIQAQFVDIKEKIKMTEEKLRSMSEILSDLTKYQRLEQVEVAHRNAPNKNNFYSAHERELIIFAAAERALQQKGIDPNADAVQFRKEYKALEQNKKQLYRDYQSLRGKVNNYKNANDNVKKILISSKQQRVLIKKEKERG